LEVGVVGGEEDGVDNEINDKLYTTDEDFLATLDALGSGENGRYLLAATFGNVHGVYKPGNVKLTPTILRDAQSYIADKYATESSKPVNFVFHGGSGSTAAEIEEALSYGVIKMNIDTDLQWAFWDGIRAYEADKHDFLQGQLGNPEGSDSPNKKHYDPRVWLRAGEESFVTRLEQAFTELNNVGTLA